jgi:hypothetical protein
METRIIRTPLGDLKVTPRLMGSLRRGDHIIDPAERAVYRVTTDCASNDRRWLYVVNLTAPPDTNPNGFFSYSLTTPMNYVLNPEVISQ